MVASVGLVACDICVGDFSDVEEIGSVVDICMLLCELTGQSIVDV